ncbi:MAG: hypothetical protein WCK77_09325 [Verrucomicrobiota bacterium]
MLLSAGRPRDRATLICEVNSVRVEDGEALRTMAACIDLNPLRAGIVKDPKHYRAGGQRSAQC